MVPCPFSVGNGENMVWKMAEIFLKDIQLLCGCCRIWHFAELLDIRKCAYVSDVR
jgi:hypothetical protein